MITTLLILAALALPMVGRAYADTTCPQPGQVQIDLELRDFLLRERAGFDRAEVIQR